MTVPADATLADVGEFGLIGLFDFPQSEAVYLGPGDDAAVLRTRSHVVVSVDVAVENRHFKREW
ncbi:MAG TPA: thiamine-phosphate kinase, partial [Marmoricola sp.]|nr:thiamine-phosphate kinase [Marmoricola sp.]